MKNSLISGDHGFVHSIITIRSLQRLLPGGTAAAFMVAFWMSPAPARASVGLTFEAPTLQAAQGSTGSFDVLISDNAGASFDLAAESVELGISGSGVEFTDTTINTVTPYVFSPSFDVDNGFSLDATGDPYPKNDFITSDLSDALAGIVINDGDTFGIVNVSYSVDPDAALGDRTLTIESIGAGTSTSDQFGNAVPFDTVDGVLTVVPVPEPASFTLAVLAAPLLMRRRRTGR
jgi:hypothetical protein